MTARRSDAAEIHDLGYDRYEGLRTPQSRRAWVIARNVFAVGWRSRWRVRAWIIASGGIALVGAVIMYVLRMKLAAEVRAHGAPLPRAEEIVFRIVGFYQFIAFILATTVGCAVVADDLRLGAFQFYFARALRPRDYVLGKLLGIALVVGIPMFCGPVFLSLCLLLFASSFSEAMSFLPYVLRGATLGILATSAFVFPSAGLGALVQRRTAAQAIYAVYFIIISSIAMGMSAALKVPALRLIVTFNNVTIIGRKMFDLPQDSHDPSLWAAILATLVISGAGLAIVYRRVAKAETAGLGVG